MLFVCWWLRSVNSWSLATTVRCIWTVFEQNGKDVNLCKLWTGKNWFIFKIMERNIDVNQCNPLISDIFFKNVQDLYHELPTNRNTTLLTEVWGMAKLSLSLRWILWVGGSQLLTWYLTLPQPYLQPDYKNVVHHPNPTFAVGSPKGWGTNWGGVGLGWTYQLTRWSF